MILFFSALDHQANHRDFSCGLSSLEANWDLLSNLVAQGNTLLTAYVIEDDVRTNLPLAAFDGFPLSADVQALQTEWRTILSTPRSANSIHKEELIALTRQRVHHAERTVIAQERMIDYFGKWLERTQKRSISEPKRSQLVHQYEMQLAKHQVQLGRAHFYSSLVTDRLNQLLS
ncbi:hypothetical protein BH09BAC4_BH09BAC4_46060 [soil metagenome]